jgi:hypothetical protein
LASKVTPITRFAVRQSGYGVFGRSFSAVAATSKSGAAARTRSVGTKLTEDEIARLESLAAESGQSVSEWARSALLEATTPTPEPS